MILGRFWMLESMNTALVEDVRVVRTAAVVTASRNFWSVNILLEDRLEKVYRQWFMMTE